MIILGRPLVALVFQRGEFDAQSTAETTWALQFYAIALFAHSGLEIVTRAFYAMHDTKTPVMVGVAAMAVNIALSLALIGPLAQGGLALATSVATILEMSTLLFILRSRFGALENGRVSLDEPRIAASIARTVAGALVMGAVLVLLVDYLAARSAVLVGLAGLAVGAGVYFGVTALLRSEEVTMVVHRLALSFRR